MEIIRVLGDLHVVDIWHNIERLAMSNQVLGPMKPL